MKTLISDTQIRASVRTCLTQHHLDAQCLTIGSARGVVRISGELRRISAGSATLRSTTLEDLERELRRQDGVRRVHLDPINWRQTSNGKWQPLCKDHGDLHVDTQMPESAVE